ncbi:hypothetical protein G6F24_018574 [Rhizopus arrhizus]|nr:hypothetical protein G6F24_018574 [Rhizopus arrhizus]
MAGLCLALAACATTGRLSSAEKLDLYRAHAGAQQNDMQFFGSLNGWTELGDSALAVWTRPSEAYLLELNGPCQDLTCWCATPRAAHACRASSRASASWT